MSKSYGDITNDVMASAGGIINTARTPSVQNQSVMTPAASAPDSVPRQGATTPTPPVSAPATDPLAANTANINNFNMAGLNSQSSDSVKAIAAKAPAYGAPGSVQSVDYNGVNGVVTGDTIKNNLAQGAQEHNEKFGTSLTPQQYDQMINPTTYGARWGIDAGQMASAGGGASAAGGPSAAGYDPKLLGDTTKWNVTPEQTTAGQLASIMDPNSPIIAQARAQGLALANERGLLNSSIGEGAAMDAAYKVAVPIANADAATQAKAAGYNADETNQFAVRNNDSSNQSLQFNANSKNVMAGQQLSADTQRAIADLQAHTQTNLNYLDNQTKTNLANMDVTTRTNLATIEANYHVLMQSNQSASDLFRQVTQNITTISSSKDMDAGAKQAAVDNQQLLLKNGMQINGAISNLNLGNLLDFGAMQSEPVPPEINIPAGAFSA